MRAALFSLMLLCVAAGCGVIDESFEAGDLAAKHSLESDADRALRVGLATLDGERPVVDYQSLLDSGDLVERGEVTGTDGISPDLRKGLLLLARYRTDRVDDERVRVQRFRFNHGFPAARLFGNQLRSALPFRVRGDADVEFARWFTSEAELAGAPRFTVLDVPHDVDSALRLPSGTVVTLPLEGHVSADVGGQFIHRAFQRGGQVLAPLNASMRGNMSAVRRGTIFGQGEFSLQVIRLPEQRVRVRLLSASSFELRSRVRGATSAAFRYVFLPSSNLDRLRAFRRAVERAGRWVRRVRTVDERVDTLRTQLPDAVRSTLDSLPLGLNGDQQGRVDGTLERVDEVLAQAQRAGRGVSFLDRLVGQRADTSIQRLRSFWDSRIAPVTTRLQRLSSRIYRLDQSVELSDRFSRTFRLLGDFEFDLSDEEARVAFEHAVSGRAVWRGVERLIPTWYTEDMTFADFTLANTIASEDQSAERPRVRRLALGGSDSRERRFSLSASAFGLRVGLDGGFESNRVEVTDDRGTTHQWLARAWERGRQSTLFGDVRSESFASGAFTAVGTGSADGYWFRWRKTYGAQHPTPVANALAHALNDLGPAATSAGVPALYQDEHPGKVEAELSVVVNPHAMDALFDSERVDAELLWSVLGDMMSRYERPMALPYAHAPLRPMGLSDAASDACEAVARRLGGRYCYSFRDRIFPALDAAQASSDPAVRLQFFEAFYRVPLGGATLSTRFLVRYLAEVFFALGIDTPFTIDLKIRNAQDDSEAASPSLVVGDPMNLALSEATALEALQP